MRLDADKVADMETKECSICHQSLPVDSFYQKDGRPNDSRCKDCICAANKERRALKPKKTHKICTMCGENLPRSEEFYSAIHRHGRFIGWNGKCKPCMVKYVAQRKAESPEYFESHRLSSLASARRKRQEDPGRFQAIDRKSDLKRKYGVTVEWYEATLHAQGGVCAICHRPPGKHRLAVDHDHEDGQVRGLLCDRCNPLLERVESTPDWMESALAYLTKFEIAKREKELSGGNQWQDQK